MNFRRGFTYRNGLGRLGQQGRAIVEYVLILVVALALGGLAKALNKGLQTWGVSIVGKEGYINCLLETGKLPNRVGNACTPIANVSFNPSSSSSSSSSGSGGYNSGSGGNSSATSSGSSNGGTDSGDSQTSGADNDGGEGTAGDMYPADDPSLNDPSLKDPSVSNKKGGSSSRGRNRSGKGKGSGSSSSSQGDYNPDGDRISINPGENSLLGGGGDTDSARGGRSGKSKRRKKKRQIKFSSGGSVYNGEPGYAGERHRAILSGGWMEQDEQKKRNRPIPVVSQNVATKKNTLTGSTKRNRMVIKKSSKAKAKEVKIGKWSFGNIFRIILIVCVIVAVVLLIGSQTYSVKKSMK